MDSSSIYWSPHNVYIASLWNEGGPHLPCPHPGCISAFSAAGSLWQHSQTGKHKFASNSPPPPSSAHLLQWFKPQLTVETPTKTPVLAKYWICRNPFHYIVTQRTQTTSYYLPSASLIHLSPRNSPTPTTQEGSTLHVHSSLSSSSSHISTMLSSSGTSSSKSKSSELPLWSSPATHRMDIGDPPPASQFSKPNGYWLRSSPASI